MTNSKFTITAGRRAANPARFARKDARTRVLALVYGPIVKDGKGGCNRAKPEPLTRETKGVLAHCLWQTGWDAAKLAQVLVDADKLYLRDHPAKAAEVEPEPGNLLTEEPVT